ncbi:hypothetical protein [Salinisphaera sp. G21_0]|uniref:hypothetical protein n=1 Tax=Salinisphaera sp. G21_0 TaxID=2821094 RepID=UPI001ADAC141|nr:hypothetical protein [Salinisphaera sp. G21_0]MBO9481821.1 hypothetical protein [Salinisphaera sp. G21_0]
MQTSNSNSSIPYIRLNNISNPENEASGNYTKQAEGNFSGHRVEKFEPDSHSQSHLLDTTNTQQMKSHNLLYDRVSKALEQKFHGSEKASKRKLVAKGALPEIGANVLGGALLGLQPILVATRGIAATAVLVGITVDSSALPGCAHDVNAKHFFHEKKWFQHLVGKGHMELFLKEVPEDDDINALEACVVKINEQLSEEQFDNTYKSLKKALRWKNSRRLKQELKTMGPHAFNIYLDLAKQRQIENQRTNVSLISSSHTDEVTHLSEEMEKLQKALLDSKKAGIDNPAFTDDI